MKSIKLKLSLVPSLNKILNWHWAKWHQQKLLWEQAVWMEIKKQKLQKIKGKVKIRIKFIFNTHHKHDWDNYIGGCKLVFDGLKNHLIEDDSMDIIKSVEFDWEYQKKSGTEIEIMEVTKNEPNRNC